MSLIAEFDRELTAEDIASLEDRPRGSKAPALVRISARHHRLARMLAEGFEPSAAGLACNLVGSRVAILQADPMFRELVEFYRGKVTERYLDMHERLSGVAETALDILQERLEDTPDDFDQIELMKLAAMGADRVGHGPSSTTNTNVNVNLGARLEAARVRMRSITESNVIDIAAEE